MTAPNEYEEENESEVPEVSDVEDAARRLKRFLKPTPMLRSERLGCRLKLENLQVTGAYKVRGALNALLMQVERGDTRPVVCASAGNHALGVAWAGRRLGLKVTAVVPESAPESKVAGAWALGARVVRAGLSFDEAEAAARSLARVQGARYLHPFDDPDVVAGQGTLAFELLSDDPDCVLVPVGGGGLASGVGLVLREYDVPVIGVQVEGVDAMGCAVEGRPWLGMPAKTLADGLKVQQPGRLTRGLCTQVLDRVLRVTEEEVAAAMAGLALFERVVAEGAGAVTAAAIHRAPGHRKVAVVSGGNVDAAVLEKVLSEARKAGVRAA